MRLPLLFSMLMLLYVSCSDTAGTLSETETGSLTAGVFGTIVNDEGTPVEKVTIKAYILDSSQRLSVADSVSTDAKGLYHFASLDAGRYYFEGTYLQDTVLSNTSIDSLTYDPQTKDSLVNLGIDTLLLPGYIKGSISLENSNPFGVLIYIPGTSHNAYADSNGAFILSNIPAYDAYSLYYTHPGYNSKTQNGITVTPEDTTTIPSIALSLDSTQTPSAPTPINATYNNQTREVTILWNKVNHPGLGGYLLYRKDSSETAADPIKISGNALITDTSFLDTVVVLPDSTVTFQYHLISQHKESGNRSDLSTPLFCKVTGHEVSEKWQKLISSKDKSYTQGLRSQEIAYDSCSQPQRTITLTYNFWIDSCEVTQKQYESIMTGTFGYDNHKMPSWHATYGKGDNYPAYWTTWYDAVLYCNALSKEAGFDTAYTYTERTYQQSGGPESGCILTQIAVHFDANGYRLPTEAEWEFAARAGSAKDLHWGKNITASYPITEADSLEIDQYAHWRISGQNPVLPVGKKYPNAFGLYDMAGNVYEICNDYFDADAYEAGDEKDPTGPSSGANIVMRGGSLISNNIYTLRSGRRISMAPNLGSRDRGFRVVRKQ